MSERICKVMPGDKVGYIMRDTAYKDGIAYYTYELLTTTVKKVTLGLRSSKVSFSKYFRDIDIEELLESTEENHDPSGWFCVKEIFLLRDGDEELYNARCKRLNDKEQSAVLDNKAGN